MSPKISAGTDLEQAVGAAQAAVGLLPSSTPLTVGEPVADSVAIDEVGLAVRAGFAGAAHGIIAIVAGQDLTEALEHSPIGNLDLTQAIRPALEAAAATLGPVVVDPGQTGRAEQVMRDVLNDGGMLVPLVEGEKIRAVIGLAVVEQVPVDETPAAPPIQRSGLDLLHDVEMEVTAELGRTHMSVRELLSLVPGTVVELDRAAGGPADILVNGTLIARGEVVVIDENYGIRVTEIVPSIEQG